MFIKKEFYNSFSDIIVKETKDYIWVNYTCRHSSVRGFMRDICPTPLLGVKDGWLLEYNYVWKRSSLSKQFDWSQTKRPVMTWEDGHFGRIFLYNWLKNCFVDEKRFVFQWRVNVCGKRVNRSVVDIFTLYKCKIFTLVSPSLSNCSNFSTRSFGLWIQNLEQEEQGSSNKRWHNVSRRKWTFSSP